MAKNPLIYPVILAGGSGTRLWPRSREQSPKQFIPLFSGKSLFQQTCLRFQGKKPFAPLTIVTHEDHRFIVRDQLREIRITNATIITEPIAKNTLAACLLASFFIEKKHGSVPVIFAPADHVITKEDIFLRTLTDVLPSILKGYIGIVGIVPSYPHTGYGYIIPSEKVSRNVFVPKQFVEKPDKDHAEKLIHAHALWNAGIYIATTTTLSIEAKKYANDIYKSIATIYKKSLDTSFGFIMIPKELYEDLPSVSIDKGISEKTKKLVVVTTDMDWSDLGSWLALYNHNKKDSLGNVLQGDTVVLETKHSYIESTSRLVTAFGVENIGLVETKDTVLLFSLTKSEQVKEVVAHLKEKKRAELINHPYVHRPWGSYEVLADDPNCKVKRIVVAPGSQLSLQRHQKRAEHWVVVSGTATVTRDDEVLTVQEHESIFIPMCTKHRLENKTKKPLLLIEVQTGLYFGEDDIERFDDSYGR